MGDEEVALPGDTAQEVLMSVMKMESWDLSKLTKAERLQVEFRLGKSRERLDAMLAIMAEA